MLTSKLFMSERVCHLEVLILAANCHGVVTPSTTLHQEAIIDVGDTTLGVHFVFGRWKHRF